MILDVANVPYVDPTAEMYCLQGAPSIYSQKKKFSVTELVQ